MNYLHRLVRYRNALIVLSALLVLAVTFLVGWLTNRDIEAGYEVPLTATLGSYVATLEGGTTNSRAMGAAILFGLENREAKQLVMGRLSPGAPEVNAGLDTLRTQYMADAALLVNRRGKVVAYSNKNGIPGTGEDLSFRPYVQRAMRGTPNVYPAVGLIDPTRAFFLAAPLRASAASASEPIGVVVIKIGADKLDDLFKTWADGIALLISPQGVVFAASRDDWLFRTTGNMSAYRLADIQRTRQYGKVFDVDPAPPLPFTPDIRETTIDDVRYAVRSQPLEWNDPAGDWMLTFLERRPPWWTHWSVPGFAALAGLITALGLFWLYMLVRNAYLLDVMNSQLQESEELLNESQGIAGLGTYTLDISTGMWQSSEVLDRLFGIDETYERSTEGWAALVHPDDRAMMIEYLRDQVIGRHAEFNKEHRIVTRDGRKARWVHALGRLEFDAVGKPVKLHGTIQDISERKQAEHEIRDSMRKLEEKELAKTRFLAAAGHDLRQPLAAANLFIDALKFTGPNPEQGRIIQRLERAMETFNGLLETLLNISRLDAGSIKPECVPVDVSELVNWLDQNFAPLATSKQIGFKLHFPARESLVVNTDIGLAKSVLMNLVSNALKFTATGGVMVSIRRRGSEALFQVWDTGMGIKPEHLERIFEEFYQVGNPQRDRASGLGLGLSIAKRALTLLGSKISCRSQIGRGSVFEFRLPLELASGAGKQHAAPGAVADELAGEGFVKGRQFVVVEDDTLVAQALADWLEGMGGETVCFYSAEDALRLTHAKHAFFIVDYMLGGPLNGIQFLNKLQQRLGSPLRAVLMTGDTSPSFIRDAADLHWPVLHKPVHPSRVIASLSLQAQ